MVYRVLSLDGGGSWALIQVKTLMRLFGAEARGREVLGQFNLVAANSGGSIVLAGLVENLPLSTILAYFTMPTSLEDFFSPPPVLSVADRMIRAIASVGPRFSSEKKLAALQKILPQCGMKPLAGIMTEPHILITGYDYDRNRAVFFRSKKVAGIAWGSGAASQMTLAQAVHASSTPPVNYFDRPAQFPGQAGRYWDGAIAGCNNPVLAAVTEAIGKKIKPAAMAVLSLGTGAVALPSAAPGSPVMPYNQPLSKPGTLTDLGKLAGSVLADPPDIATFLAHVMIHGTTGIDPDIGSRVVRMNPLISPVKKEEKWTYPGMMTAAQFTELVKLDLAAVKAEQLRAISTYADLWLAGKVPNQPIRMNGDSLACELGQAWFDDALEAWRKVGS